jgi:hypothetical protein
MTARPPRSLVLLGLLLACAAALVAPLVGCGEPDAPSSSPAAPPTATPEQATYPIRHLFVEARDTARSPTKPPRTREEALAFARATVARLRAPGADFAAIAREVSDDAVTAASEGFGGFRSYWAGDEPAVVDAASKLSVGEVSEPVPAPAGFHVIQRLSRDEGRALEARVVVPMEGMLFRWVEIDPKPEPHRTKAEAYAEAADAVVKLRSGAEVERLVLELMNVRTFALPMRRNGIAGWNGFVDASFAAEVGEWIGPIETPDGWAVARRQPCVRAGVRHLVVTHRDSPGPSKRSRSRDEALAIATGALRRLTEDPASWAQVVADTSDEPGSRAVGGYLGDFTTTAEPGQRMAPEVERELLSMTPGTRSTDVVESRFGFHIFWRLD